MQACDHDFEEVSALGDRGKSYECVLCSYTYRDDPYQEPAGFINHFGVPIAQYNLKYYQPKQNLCYMDWILTEEETAVLQMLVKSHVLVDKFDGLEKCLEIIKNAPQGSVGYHTMYEGYFSARDKQHYEQLNHVMLADLKVAVEHVQLTLSYKGK